MKNIVIRHKKSALSHGRSGFLFEPCQDSFCNRGFYRIEEDSDSEADHNVDQALQPDVVNKIAVAEIVNPVIEKLLRQINIKGSFSEQLQRLAAPSQSAILLWAQ